jgi:hypothetical protein
LLPREAASLAVAVGGGRVDVVDHHMGAFAGIGERDVAADATAAAGDDGDLVFEAHRTFLSWNSRRSR